MAEQFARILTKKRDSVRADCPYLRQKSPKTQSRAQDTLQGTEHMGYLDRLSRGLGYDSYQGYLDSEHWSEVVSQHKRGACFCCRARKWLQLHHVSYANLGRETGSDLVTVCRKCHRRIHREVRAKRLSLLTAHLSLIRRPKRRTKRKRRRGRL